MPKPGAVKKEEVRSLHSRELRIATGSDGKCKLVGYAAVFNSLSVDMGGWFEIVTSSAFTRTLQENPDVYALFAHKAPMVLGRTKSGTLALAIDDKGLRFEVDLPDTNAARDLIELIERGDIDACSFGFICINDIWSEDAEGRIVRQLLDVDLHEITVTPMPAYPATSVSLRSAPVEIRARLERRDDDDNTDDCSCGCPECVAGDCDNCTDADCDDENCSCMSKRAARKAESASARENMNMRLQVARARAK